MYKKNPKNTTSQNAFCFRGGGVAAQNLDFLDMQK